MRPRSVLITGASSGIGRALAIEYARGGARLALCARREAELEALAAEVRALGSEALPLPLDVRDVDAVGQAVRRADQEIGPLEMVIANAGRGGMQHATRLAWKDVAEILEVNVRGAIATIIAAIPIFLAHQRGHIVGISSLAGRRALPMHASYCASKSALSTFLEALRLDLVTARLLVTDVQPGFVETPLVAASQWKPFLWSAEKAARHIVRRLESGPAAIAFPLPLVLATSLGRILPPMLYDRFIAGAGRSSR